jgi:hypothetical protein
MFVHWCNLTQSTDSGEADEGWPTYEAAASAVSGAQEPAWMGRCGLVLGDRAALLRAQAADIAHQCRDQEGSIRRSATLASFPIAAAVAVAVAKANMDRTLVLLASNRQSLISEQAKGRRAEVRELNRLQANVDGLLARLAEVTR